MGSLLMGSRDREARGGPRRGLTGFQCREMTRLGPTEQREGGGGTHQNVCSLIFLSTKIGRLIIILMNVNVKARLLKLTSTELILFSSENNSARAEWEPPKEK